MRPWNDLVGIAHLTWDDIKSRNIKFTSKQFRRRYRLDYRQFERVKSILRDYAEVHGMPWGLIDGVYRLAESNDDREKLAVWQNEHAASAAKANRQLSGALHKGKYISKATHEANKLATDGYIAHLEAELRDLRRQLMAA